MRKVYFHKARFFVSLSIRITNQRIPTSWQDACPAARMHIYLQSAITDGLFYSRVVIDNHFHLGCNIAMLMRVAEDRQEADDDDDDS